MQFNYTAIKSTAGSAAAASMLRKVGKASTVSRAPFAQPKNEL